MQSVEEHIEAAEELLKTAAAPATHPGRASMLCHAVAKHLDIAAFVRDQEIEQPPINLTVNVSGDVDFTELGDRLAALVNQAARP